MYNNKTFLVIIPARGGSKRLPSKNTLDLEGKPLITYTIDAAIRSKYIDTTVVTSDDSNILAIAQQYKVTTIKRPALLANDTAKTFDVIIHTIENITKKYDYIVLLQPTSPLRNNLHLDKAIEILFSKEADAIISVCQVEHNPLWSNTLPNDDSMDTFLPNNVRNKRSQDLESYFRLNGAIYICKTDRLLSEKSFFINSDIFAYKMSREDSIDIDERIDFELAKLYMKETNDFK